MHVSARKIAFGGLLLAVTVIFMLLGSVIESNTLFLLAAASYFVGIIIREFGWKSGAAFYAAGVLLGFLIAPNKFYVCSYAAMGLYLLAIEAAWPRLGRMSEKVNRRKLFWVIKYLVFNLIYIPVLLGFGALLFGGEMTPGLLSAVLVIGQIGLFLYDRAYDYVQSQLWGKVRGRILGGGFQ